MRIFFILIFISLSEILSSQVLQEWTARYNNYFDIASSIATDNHGNIIVTGSSTGTDSEDDYLTIKYNPSGDQLWLVRYNGPGNFYDIPVKVVVDENCNSYVTGSSWGKGTGNDIATVKYDSNGVQQWVVRYNGKFSGSDNGSGIAIDQDENVFVIGHNSGYVILKYNATGVLLWEYTSKDGSRAVDIKVDDNGNSYITGVKFGSFGFFDDIFTVKFDSSGNIWWENNYNGVGQDDDVPFALVLDSSDNVIVTGRSIGNDSHHDIVTIKYSSDGNEQWVANYSRNPNVSDVATCMTTDNKDNVIVAGFSQGNFVTIKYNNLGIEQWASIYDGPSNNTEGVESIVADELGNIYVTGESVGTGKFFDYVTIKYNSDGLEKWLIRYTGNDDRNDKSYDLALDKFGNIYVTGFSVNEFLNSDFLTVKYSQTVGINSQFNLIPSGFSLKQNYPNPFNPTTIINYEIPLNVKGQTSNVKLTVYNALGKEIATLVNENQNAGIYSVEWNGANYSSGVYFYKFTTDNFSEIKKMTLLK